MPAFNWARWLRSLYRRPRVRPYRRTPTFSRLRLEQLEDRTMLSVLPAATVTGQQSITVPITGGTTNLSGFSPSVVQDPVNSAKLFAAYSTGTAIGAAYSTDGGTTWTGLWNTDPLKNAFPNIGDPELSAPYNEVRSVSVSMDRAQNIYVTLIEQDNLSSGALVFERQSFSGAKPTAVTSNEILQQWVGFQISDITDAVVAADSNVSTTDTMAALSADPNNAGSQVPKGLFVAWSTDQASAVSSSVPSFNPNVIMEIGSENGGATWTSPQLVNQDGFSQSNGGSATATPNVPRFSEPQIVFTQGSADGRVAGGQMAIVWNDFGNQTIDLNSEQPDGGVAGNHAAAAVVAPGTGGTFYDAYQTVIQQGQLENYVKAGGKNYNIGDVLTVQGGTMEPAVVYPSQTQAQLQVTNVDMSASPPTDAVLDPEKIVTGSEYLIVPANAVATTGGGNNAATFDLSYIPNNPVSTTFTDNVSIADATFTVEDVQVTLDISDPDNVSELSIDLISPLGVDIPLMGQGSAQGTLGMGIENGFNVGTVFQDNAARSIGDPGAYNTNYIGSFRPASAVGLDTAFGGLQGSSGAISGTWKLKVTDNVNDNSNPSESVTAWSLRFSDTKVSSDPTKGALGKDQLVPLPTPANSGPGVGTSPFVYPVPGAISDGGYGMANVGPFGPSGVAPSISVAVDNTLGANSPFQGRLYIAFTAVGQAGLDGTANVNTNTDIYMISADGLGSNPASATWNNPIQVNDDSVVSGGVLNQVDNFSEGTRPQFMPTVAVDQTTGTVGVMYYDGRWDPSLTRVGNSFSTSIDGGQTFSTSTFLNTPKTAIDMITEQTITLEPVPGNQGQVGTFGAGAFAISPGFGDRQGLVMNAGRAVPIFFSNDNAAGDALMTAIVNYGAGPRILSGSMGPITSAIADVSTILADGTPELTGFVVTFDRPVNPGSFDGNDVVLEYKLPTTSAAAAPDLTYSGTSLATGFTVTALNASTTAWGPETLTTALATEFEVALRTPAHTGALAGKYVGTYSYSVGPGITDGLGNSMDENANGTTSENPGSTLTALTISTTNPGVGYNVGDLLTVNGGVATTKAQVIVTSVGPAGNITSVSIFNPGYYTTLPATGNVTLSGGSAVFPFLARFNLSFTSKPGDTFAIPTPLDGGPFTLPYNTDTLPLVIPGPHVVSSSVPGNPATSDNLVLNNTNNAVDVTFDRNIVASTFTSANIIRVTGPAGPIPSYSMSTPAALVGGGTLTSTLNVTDSLAVLNLGVEVNIGLSAGTDANLSVTLVAPDGTVVPLFSGVGGAGSGFTNTIFDNYSTTAIGAGTAPFTGTFAPTGSLASLNSKDFLGAWKLQVNDSNAGGAGVLNGWTLNPFTVTPIAPAGSPASTRTFQIGMPTQALSGTYNIVVGPDAQGNYVTDVNGFQGDTNLNAGVDALFGADPNNGALVPTAYPSVAPNNNLSLPPGQVIDSIINVPDSYVVQGVVVQLTILHQNDPDLVATLISPTGQSDLLFSDVGNSGTSPHANFTLTTFDDSASLAIQQAATVGGAGGIGIGVGPWTPQVPLTTAFKGVGSLGNWMLQITSNSSTLTGTLVDWTLTLKASKPGSGLAEPVADQFTANYRIFTQDPTNPVSQTNWTAMGPAAIGPGTGSGPEDSSGSRSGRIGGIAVDPSDPSGNTVYTAGASGGVWKTTDFMTTSADGPTWFPVTNLGQGYSLNTGGIAIFGRNNDPTQSIIFVATGEGSTVGSATGTGVGFLRSMDGGKTWNVLDSMVNVDASGNILPISSPLRNHEFVGSSAFKVVVDPTMGPNGVIVYAALSGTNGGVWRSNDSGGHWTRVMAGNATDVALSNGSADASGNLQILYGAFRGLGVYYTTSATSAISMSVRNGGGQAPFRFDSDVNPETTIATKNTAGVNPTGAFGRVLLATPAKMGNTLEDTLYAGWLYALVVSGGGVLQDFYMTKDFGLNWVQVDISVKSIPIPGSPLQPLLVPTNNDSLGANYSVMGNGLFKQGNYDVSLAVDPNNPNIVYMGGTEDANPPGVTPGGFIRLDTTKISDPYADVAYDNSDSPANVQLSTTGSTVLKKQGQAYGILGSETLLDSGYINQLRDPANPFLNPSSLQFTNVSNFNNTPGQDITWMGFDGGGLGGTDQHELVAYRDPITGETRLIFGDDQGIWAGTDNGTGNPIGDVGFASDVVGDRNGDLQITQFYYGANQPSTLAAQIAGAMFYGTAQDDGYPTSDASILDNGNLVWAGPGGDYAGVATDQTGSGTSYVYAWPCCGATPLPSDFFLVNPDGAFGSPGVSRITGLLQPGDNPGTQSGQWLFTGGSEFAVNPVDPSAIIMSSSAGRLFRTSGTLTGYGVQWFPIAEPSDLDGSYAGALAFGAPSAPGNVALNDFIYAGTSGGHIYVTTVGGGDGGGAAVWKNISAGLDGSSVEQIVTNPNRGSDEAYAVTTTGVFWTPDSLTTAWKNISGNLFSATLTRTLYDDPNQTSPTLKFLTTIQADYRYAIPNTLSPPSAATHPVLYVGGMGGVFRSLDNGTTWTYFPDITIDGALQEGGYLPSAYVTELNLSLGNINPATGFPYEPYGRNLLQATTYGSGTFGIRLTDTITVPGSGGAQLHSYAVSPVAGPHVASIKLVTSGTSVTGLDVTFSGIIDPVTFTAADIHSLTAPDGTTIALAASNGVEDITGSPSPNPHNLWQLNLATPVAEYGFYSISLGPKISDYAGYQMDQNENGINGENPGDIYTGRVLFNPNPNNAPVLSGAGLLPAFPAVNEDQTAAVINGESVYAFVQSMGWPLSGLTDADNSSYAPLIAPVGIAIIAVDDSNGVWQYSQNGGPAGTWTAISGVSAATALLLEASSGGPGPNGTANANNWIRFLPNVDFSTYSVPAGFGPTVPTLTFKAWDETSGLNPVTGADGGTADTSPNGNPYAFSSATGVASIGVNFVNDQPSFTKGPDQGVAPLILEDSGAYTVANWATNISQDLSLPVDANEAGQTLNFIVTNNNNALFAVQPAISPTGTLTYTLANDQSGAALVTVKLHDNGGTAFGGIDTSVAQTFNITVTFVNDAPSFTKGADQTVLEDSGAQTVSPWATSVSPDENFPPATNESLQTVNFIVTNNNNALFSVQPAISATGTLTYTLANDQSGTALVTVLLHDNGGTANGGIDTSAAQTFNINVTFVNDAPSFTKGADQTHLEDSGAYTVSNWATKISPDENFPAAANESGQIVNFIVTNNNNALFAVQPAISPTGTLTYTLANDQSGTALVTVLLHDNGGTANGGVDTSAAQTFNINVTFVNDAPSFTAGPSLTIPEDSGAQSFHNWATNISADENIVTAANEAGQLLNFIVSNNNNALFAVQPAIDATGHLTYTPNPDVNGVATVTVQLHDNGGTANGGVDTSAAQMFMITITYVNDAPSFTKGADQTVLEDTGAQTVPNWATKISPDENVIPAANETGQLLNFIVSNNNNALFAVQPSISPTGQLTYTPAANMSGSAIVTVQLHDNGGTANGGVDTSTAVTFNINVTFINDAPSFTKGADQTALENAGAQTVTGWATKISPDQNVTPAANEAGQALNFIVSNNNNALFAAQPSIDASGDLTYTPAADASGTALVTVQLHDNGGTANGGVDTSAAQTFNINVTFVNDAPSFTKGADQSVLEDAAAQSVTGWATSISPDQNAIPAANEAGQALNFIVTNNNNALFAVQPSISPTGTLTYTLANDQSGTGLVTVQLHDNGGTANGGVDTSAAQTFNINVTYVNDAPSFTRGPDQALPENAPAQTVTGWATNISPDENPIPAANEAGQTVNFIVTNNNNSLFMVQPSISPTGTLTYTPAANVSGAAVVTVKLHDNGGTANGGVDTSAPQTFNVSINYVNQEPSFTKGADQTVLENAGPQTVAGWATNMSPDQSPPPVTNPIEASQTLNFIVTNNNNALFAVQPSVNATTGTLTYTPATDASGTALVTVEIHDNGGTANGGIDTSGPQTFNINVTFVNQPPSFTKGADQTILENAGPQTVTGWATNVSPDQNFPPAANEAGQTVNFVVSNNNNALFAVQPSISSTGQLTYTPATDSSGSAIVTVQLHDNGGTANGGVDTSAAQTFNVNVTFVNQPPSFTKGADQTVPENAGAQTATGWATKISPDQNFPPAANEAGQAVNFIVSNSNNALFAVQPSISSTGQLTYTPAANSNGSAVVTVKLHDNGGTANGGVDTSAAQTFNINVLFVNQAPSFTKGADQTVLENASAQTVAGWATNVSPDGSLPPYANEAGQTLNFLVSNNNNALFAVQPSISATGTLTYTSAANSSGTALVTVQLHDNGGTANGGVDTSAAQTFSINVLFVNQAPSFTKGADQTALENSGVQTVSGWATSISPDGSLPAYADEAGETLNFIVSNNNNALFAVQPSISPTGTLTYTPATDQSGTAAVMVQLHDNGGTANGGHDTSAAQTFNINVTFVNQPPSFAKGSDQAVAENSAAQTVTGWATNISPDQNFPPAANEAGQSVNFIVSNNNNSLFTVQPSISPTGTLTYTPAANAIGTAVVTVQLHDNGGTANGGVDTSAAQTFNITLNYVNLQPSFTKGADQTVRENAGPQTVAGWATNMSPDQSPPPAVNSTEAAQVLNFIVTNNNNALFAVQPSVNATTGTLTYTPATDASGSALITVEIHDNGGTASGGIDTSAPQTFNINVTFVNQPPSFTKGSDQTVLENAGPQTVTGWATNVSPDQNFPPAANEAGQAVNFIVSNSNNALFGVQPSISPTGQLTYTPATESSGSAIVTVELHDNGGTANGGIDTSASQTFNINVLFVNQPPSFTKGADQTVLENASAQTITGWATNISPDQNLIPAANEAGQTVNFIVSNNNNALFAVQPNISPTGKLTYAPAANSSGTALVTVQLHDNGGTANGGVDTSAAQTFDINVLFVNQAPSFAKGADQTTLENAGPQTASGWATSISPDGSLPAYADEAGQTLNFIVNNNNNGLFAVQPSISPTGTLTYTPATDQNGSALVTVQLHDNGGTANGGNDTSAAQTFNINVTFVNQPPSFTKGADQTVLENAGPQTVAAWATNVSPDQNFPPAANEAGQSVSFIFSNNNNSLFTVQPSISPTGQLTYTPAPYASGSAIVTVQLHDNGGTANGGVDTSAAQTFNINVLFVNRAPSFTKGADQTVPENAGPQTVVGWASKVSPDQSFPPQSDEVGQALNFIVTSTNNALFAVQPSIDPATGTLTYTPAADSSGSAVVSVQLHDNGGTANGGVDTSGVQTFNINVLFVNQAPSFTKGADQTVLENAGAQTLAGWAINISPDQNLIPAANEAGQSVNFLVSNNNNALFAVQPSISPTGQLTYTPAANSSGTAVVTVQLHDNGGTANGGHDTSAAQTFNINVLFVNQAPSFTKGADQTALENAGARTVAGWATSISPDGSLPPYANEAGQTLNFIVTNTNNALFAVQPSISPTGTLTYTPATNTRGSAVVTVKLHDNGGTANGGADTSAPQTFVINVMIGTTTTLTVPANSTYGQTVTFTAHVIPAAGSAGPLTGETVTFDDGSTFLGTGTLASSGIATISTSALLAGSHSITAIYAGDTTYAGSSSAAQNLMIAKAGTTLSVSSSQPSSTVGQSVTFTSQITPASGGTNALAGETVTFKDGATIIGTGTINASGTATIFTSTLSAGAHTITAVYNGDPAQFSGSSGTANQQVKNTTTTNVSSSANPAVVGTSLTFTAAVIPGTGSASALAGGTVQFLDGVTLLGTGILNAGGLATFSTAGLALGSHTISAAYTGAPLFLGSTSSTLTETVAKKSAITLRSSAAPSTVGKNVNFTATVTGSGGTPTGTVTFYVDGVMQQVVNLSGGQAVFSISTLKAGNHAITAVYSGDATFAPVTGKLSQIVYAKAKGRRI